MKNFGILAIVFVIIVSCAACGRNDDPETVAPTTNSTGTESTMIPDVIPDVLPTIETNIPDPSVDTEMPMYTEGTEGTAETSGDTTQNTK